MKSVPIDIPSRPKSSSGGSGGSGGNGSYRRLSPTVSLLSKSLPPSHKYILLQGNGETGDMPFINKMTVTNILSEAMPSINKSSISRYIEEVNVKGETYIKVNKDEANNICTNLVENGLHATIVK